jgi:Uma2 family endonuclease
MATTATKLLTADDVLAMPDDDYRYELVRGVLHRMPPPGVRHGFVVTRTSRSLDIYAEETGSGVVFSNGGVILERDPDTVRGPDVAFIRADRLPEGADIPGYLPFGPDLAVEVASPSDKRGEVERKIAENFAAGTRLVWRVDPAKRTVTARTPDGAVRVYAGGDDLDGGEVLPGFRVPVSKLFGPRSQQQR